MRCIRLSRSISAAAASMTDGLLSTYKQGFIQAPFGGESSPPNLATSPPRIFGQLWFPRQLFVLTF